MIKTSKISGIYKIVNIATGKIYIGSSKDIEQRWYEHKMNLKHQRHNNVHLQKSFNNHDQESFKIDIIEQCDVDKLLNREQFYLDTLQPYQENGYNICKFSTGGDNITNHPNRENIIAKMTATQKQRFTNMTKEERDKYLESMRGENHPNYGKKYSKERKLRLSKIQKEVWKNSDRRKREAAELQRKRSGWKHTEEAKRKMKESRAKRDQ